MSTTKAVAIITGASSGIGKATALLFAKNGYRLSLAGRNEINLKQVVDECIGFGLSNEQIVTTIGDVREEKTLFNIVKQTNEKFGQIDVLVNNAGIIDRGGAETTPLSVFDDLMDVNFPAVTYYCMSKAAVDKFTECLAQELAPKGIRVNAVNPALIVTSLHRRAYMSEEEYKDFVERGKAGHALGRCGTVEEVAQGILYLARDATFTTGELLKIDGGKSLLVPR
uniref:3-oxoacyl-[acyl-carrier-protein] reductase n=1 Tax=Meloidogyne hapla TaxID=6305 RepID=A0A1I8B901_MELHA